MLCAALRSGVQQHIPHKHFTLGQGLVQQAYAELTLCCCAHPFLCLGLLLRLFCAVLCCAVLPSGLVCSIIFLTYTVSPRARAKSCGGNCGPCIHWGCDLGWDCFWAVLWAAETGLAFYVAVKARQGRPWATVAISFGMFLLYVATAVMVGKVRESVKWRASEDIEAAKGGVGAVGGVGVVGPYTTAPPAVRM